ncbi:MAG: bifunctional phosphopantothenoylcysteine decarboxylase/phosphopantothenate--cysteine ligase CoaBC [Clostridia bacterium]|nr:bifunctional phosphopantothenoylcysteine decarboxylase/phosphopantothenate--cysteine ligase CoaBC [Clostridia bacterium]
MAALDGKTVVLGVTGGIAAYKSCELTSRLRKAGARVHVIMTKHACEFVAPLTFETLSNSPCVTDTFDRPERWEVEHVALAKAADLFVIAPATANILAKMACGVADDMLSTTVLATKAPVLVAPAMNTGMWTAPATQANLETLRARGVQVIGPEGGRLACGDVGAGRMSEPADIVERCVALLTRPKDLAGLRVLVTAGPTREAVDPVRFLTNRSSGKMGYAVAEAALARGAQVTLVTGPVSLPAPAGAEVVNVQTTEDLLSAMLRLCPEQDVVVQSAAPADYKPEEIAPQKLKKTGDGSLTLRLVATPDVAKAVGERKKAGQTLVGFAAETEALGENALKKLESKNLDLIVANDVTRPGAGFDVDTNIAAFITRDGEWQLPLMSKRALADELLTRVLTLRGK